MGTIGGGYLLFSGRQSMLTGVEFFTIIGIGLILVLGVPLFLDYLYDKNYISEKTFDIIVISLGSILILSFLTLLILQRFYGFHILIYLRGFYV